SGLIYFGSGFHTLFHVVLHFCSRLIFESTAYYSKLLGNMLFSVPGSRTAAFLTGYNVQCNVPVPEFTANVGPGAHVFGLFLNPNELSGIFVFIAYGPKLIHRGRVQLFNPNDSYVFTLIRLLFFQQIVVDFTGAEEHPFHVSRLHEAVVDHLLELRFRGEFTNVAHHFWVAEQTLRRENNQRFAIVTLELPSQNMEKVGRRGAV